MDRGAYEFGIGDYNCDRMVDLADLLFWYQCMTGPGAGPYGEGCEAFDANADADTDLQDLATFQNTSLES